MNKTYMLTKNAPMMDKTVSLQKLWGFEVPSSPNVEIESVKNCYNQLLEEVSEIYEDVIDGYYNGKSQPELQKDLLDVAIDITEFVNQMVVRSGLHEQFKEAADKIYRNNGTKVCSDYLHALDTVEMYSGKDVDTYIEKVDNHYVVKRLTDNKVMKPYGFQEVVL